MFFSRVIVATTRKHELPNYGTFDEKRLFASGPLPSPMAFRGISIGVPICEDVWYSAVCDMLACEGAQRDAEQTIQNDPAVQALLAQFRTARIVPGSIKALSLNPNEPRTPSP